MDVYEHSGTSSFVSLIESFSTKENDAWGIARIKKKYLRPITDEAFVFAIKSALQEADIAHIFFVDAQRIFVVWSSQKKSIYRQLRALVSSSLVRPGLNIEPSSVVAYICPHNSGENLLRALKASPAGADPLFDKAESFPIPDHINSDDNNEDETLGDKPVLVATPVQINEIQQLRGDKKYRKQLQFLVVEDQLFSQKLLCEILRSARFQNNNETPLIDAVTGLKEAWKLYLKKLPDIVFVDLGLVDGSGHTLVRAIKEIDPDSCLIIVTANNYEEEISVARQNNADGFISKPYNKKQIFDCIESYVRRHKLNAMGVRYGNNT